MPSPNPQLQHSKFHTILHALLLVTFDFTGPPWDATALQVLLTTRVCGSPATDGYAHVDARCLEGSPTNVWWQRAKLAPGDLEAHIEQRADYDGVAVAWGIGNKKGSIEECAAACKAHMPPGVGECGPPSAWFETNTCKCLLLAEPS